MTHAPTNQTLDNRTLGSPLGSQEATPVAASQPRAHLDGGKALAFGRRRRLNALQEGAHVAIAGGLALIVERARDDEIARLLPAGRAVLRKDSQRMTQQAYPPIVSEYCGFMRRWREQPRPLEAGRRTRDRNHVPGRWNLCEDGRSPQR